MEEQEKKQEQSFELRSEKVRSIVGQVPSSLIRYGITIIGVALLCIFVIAYLLPHKQVYTGVATIHKVPDSPLDSTEVVLLLKFESKRPMQVDSPTLSLQAEAYTIEGKILSLSPLRDTLGRQETLTLFPTTDIKFLEHQSVDFQLVQSSGSLLQKLLVRP